MSPVHSDNVGASYTWQLLICLGLIGCVTIAMGAYIVHLNARIDKQRELSPVYLHECDNGRGGFIVYPDGRRSSDSCYPIDEAESTGIGQMPELPGPHRAQWLKYILPTVEDLRRPDVSPKSTQVAPDSLISTSEPQPKPQPSSLLAASDTLFSLSPASVPNTPQPRQWLIGRNPPAALLPFGGPMAKMAIFLFGFLALTIGIGLLATISPV